MEIRGWGHPCACRQIAPVRPPGPQANVSTAALTRFYGPTQLVELPGKGRGLVLTDPVEAGQLVLSSLPVVMVQGTSDTEALLEVLHNLKLTPAQQKLLSLAHGYVPPDSLAAPGTATGHHSSFTPDLRWLYGELQRMDDDHCKQQLPQVGPAATTSAAGTAPAAHTGSATREPETGSPLWAMYRRVLELNCASEEEADVMMKLGWSLAKQQLGRNNKGPTGRRQAASTQQQPAQSNLQPAAPAPALDQLSACQVLSLAAAVPAAAAAATLAKPAHRSKQAGRHQGRTGVKHKRQQTGAAAATTSCVGLWVEHAWMNHSCAPNVTNYTLGNVMVVRAGTALPAGTELQDTYLGSTLTQPLQARRTALEAQYGFICQCQRCRCEEAVQAAVPELLPAFTQLQQQLSSSWEPLAKVLLTQRRGSSGHARHPLARGTNQDTKRQSGKQQTTSSSLQVEDLIQELQDATSSIQQLVTTALARASTQEAVLAALHPVHVHSIDQEGQHLHATITMAAGGASNHIQNDAALQRAQSMLLFSVFGVFELLAVCRQHQATSLLLSQQPPSNRQASRAGGATPSQRKQQTSLSAQHHRAVQVAAAAAAAAQVCAELAGVVVPGSQLHTATALSAWSSAATHMSALDNQGGTSSEGGAIEVHEDTRRHALLHLAHAQQQLEAALESRYGPAEVAASLNSSNAGSSCLEAMLNTLLADI